MDKPVGGDTDDSFVATGATLGSLDVITGGAGTDTLTIKDTTKASSAGMPATLSGIENIEVTSNSGLGAAASSATTNAGAAEVVTVTPSGVASTPVAFSEVAVTINGRTYESGTLTSNNSTAAHAGTETKNLLAAALGNSVTLGSVDSTTGVFTVTAAAKGQVVPDFTVAITNGTGGVTAVTAADTTDAAIIQSSAASTSDIVTFTLTAGTAASGDAFTVYYDGLAFPIYTGSTQGTAMKGAVAQINALYGKTIASLNAGETVITIIGEDGKSLPSIGFDVAGDGTTDPSIARSVQRVATLKETAAVSKVTYDASKATEKVTATAEGDIDIKLASTATAVLATTSGSATVSGGADVTVTATKGVTLSGSALTNAEVKAGTTSSVVAIGATSGTTGTAAKLVTAKVTGGSDVLVTDETNGVSSGTLTSVEIAGTADTTVTLEGKSLTNLIIGTQTAATTIAVTNAATDAHTLNVTAGKSGSYIANSPKVVTVADLTAEAINVEFTAANANIALDGDATLLSVVATGAGGGQLDLNGGTSGNGIVSFDASGNSGGLAIANIPSTLKSFNTGSGNDSFTMLQTAIVAVNAGAGNDTVTINAALAAGSTVNLQDGNDVLLKDSSGSVATDSTSIITTIDAGDGLDTLGANLITAGNGDQFLNFEVLGLTNSSVDVSLLTGSSISALALLAGGGTFSGVTPAMDLTVTNIGSNSNTTTLSYGTAGLGASDGFTINFADPNADLSKTAPTSANVEAGVITASGVENYVITSGGTLAWNSITLGANADAETVTITGASNLDLAIASSGFGSATAPATGMTLIDGSAATGKLAIDITGVGESVYGITVKGGSAVDTITTGGEDVTLTLGGGADIVLAYTSSNSGITVASTGSATAAEAVSELITITDAAFGDLIDFAAATSGITVSGGVDEIDVSGATTLLGALTTAANTGATSGAEVDWFYYGGNTYALYDASAASSGGLASGDIIIKLTGLVDLTNSTLDAGGIFTLVQ